MGRADLTVLSKKYLHLGSSGMKPRVKRSGPKKDRKNVICKQLTNLFAIFANQKGELAHLVERQVRNLKVVGSIPIFSTFPLQSLYILIINNLQNSVANMLQIRDKQKERKIAFSISMFVIHGISRP